MTSPAAAQLEATEHARQTAAVAAWALANYRTETSVRLVIHDPVLKAEFGQASEALRARIADREAEIADAWRAIRAGRLVRHVQGLAEPVVPPRIEPSHLWRVKDVAPWVYRNRASITLTVGAWLICNGSPHHFRPQWAGALAFECGRLDVLVDLEGQATQDPTHGARYTDLRARAESLAYGAPAQDEDDNVLFAAIHDRASRWYFDLPRTAAPEPEKPAADEDDEVTERILAYLRRNPGASGSAVVKAIGGRKETVLAQLHALHEPGRIANSGTADRPRWNVVD